MVSDFSIRHAAHIIRQGGIIAYPTDTIYGLGCDPYNADAVAHINTIKQRPQGKQFILLAGHIDQIKPLLLINDEQEKLIMQTREATSWIIHASKRAPLWLLDRNHSLTIRISDNEVVQKLCKYLGHAIISTSANPSATMPARNSLELHRYFHHVLDKILATNQKLTAKPSKIIRLEDNSIIRP